MQKKSVNKMTVNSKFRIKLRFGFNFFILRILFNRQRVHQALESAATRPIQFAVDVDARLITSKNHCAHSVDIQLLRPVLVSSYSALWNHKSIFWIVVFRQLVCQGKEKEDHRNRSLPLSEGCSPSFPQWIPRRNSSQAP